MKARSIKKLVFIKGDIQNKNLIESIFSEHKFHSICHLAAQAGVRYSLENPEAYINSNILGFYNIVEASKNHKVNKIIFASSSSVYGNNKKGPIFRKRFRK